MKTNITDLLGIQYPIMCGGILWIAVPKLCIAISKAGGLGNITAANYDDANQLRDAIREVKSATDKPFCVNVTLLPSFRITETMYDMFFDVCAEEKVPVMEISGRPASKYIEKMHKAGTIMIHKVGTVEHAKKIESTGYDAVIALGYEAGGHPHSDNVTTMLLTPSICDKVTLPVITSGGIVDGRSMAAALSLGASGVMMATRFCLTQESDAHPKIKAEFLKRKVHDTTIICKSLDLQGRAVKNSIVNEILYLEEHGASSDEIFPLISGQRGKEAWRNGDSDSALFMMGQSIGRINDLPTCKDLIDDMVKNCKSSIEHLF